MLDGGAVLDLIAARMRRTVEMAAKAELMIQNSRDAPHPDLDRLQGHIDRIYAETVEFGSRVLMAAPFATADDVHAAMQREIAPVIRAMESLRDHLDGRLLARRRD